MQTEYSNATKINPEVHLKMASRNNNSASKEVIEINDDDSSPNVSYRGSSKRSSRAIGTRELVTIDDTNATYSSSRRRKTRMTSLKDKDEKTMIDDDLSTNATCSSSSRRLKRNRSELRALQAFSPLNRKRVINLTDADSSFSPSTSGLYRTNIERFERSLDIIDIDDLGPAGSKRKLSRFSSIHMLDNYEDRGIVRDDTKRRSIIDIDDLNYLGSNQKASTTSSTNLLDGPEALKCSLKAASIKQSQIKAKNLSSRTRTAMDRVLEIFPEMEMAFIRKSLLDGGIPINEQDAPLKLGFENALQVILSTLSEKPSYPKEPKAAKIASVPSNPMMKTTPLHDYSSPSAEYERSPAYRIECAAYVMSIFPFLTSVGVTEYLKALDHRFFLCHERICDIIKGRDVTQKTEETEIIAEKQLNEIERVLKGENLTKEQTTSFHSSIGATKSKRITRKRPRVGPTSTVTDPILLNEIQFTHNKFNEWKAQLNDSISRKLARAMSEKEGTTLECSCCFGDYAFEEMVSCKNEGHLFCFDCLKRHASERVFGVGDLGGAKTAGDEIELKCMHTGKNIFLHIFDQYLF